MSTVVLVVIQKQYRNKTNYITNFNTIHHDNSKEMGVINPAFG